LCIIRIARFAQAQFMSQFSHRAIDGKIYRFGGAHNGFTSNRFKLSRTQRLSLKDIFEVPTDLGVDILAGKRITPGSARTGRRFKVRGPLGSVRGISECSRL
jgi:hypothetical protein